MYSFLTANNFIEHNIQKGFTPNHGTMEHTAQMANIINKARIKQRSLVMTLLDLKNAFGEVHHNLIQSVLGYHHIPNHMNNLIKSLYTDFKTSVITSEFRTILYLLAVVFFKVTVLVLYYLRLLHMMNVRFSLLNMVHRILGVTLPNF